MFIKYESINDYYNGYNRQLEIYPKLLDAEYLIQEKIHGANLQLIFDSEITIASRNKIVGYYPDRIGAFYNLSDIIPEYFDLIKTLSEYFLAVNKRGNVYCEFFGEGIQKEIYYGPKQIRVLDIKVNEKYLSSYELVVLFRVLHLSNYIAPILDVIKGIDNCSNFDVERDSVISERKNNIMEGVVIKPYKYGLGPEYYLKKKSISYLERTKPKEIRINSEIQEIQEIREIHEEFLDYITKSRMNNIFSNYGPIEEITQLGEYIRHIIEDAKKDFIIDNNFEVTKDNRKAFNVAKEVAKMLKEYLNSMV